MKKIALSITVMIVVGFTPCWIGASKVTSKNNPEHEPAKPEAGFYWDYYLYMPTSIKVKTTLLVIPNNTGTGSDDLKVHDKAAKDEVASSADMANKLRVPLLVPVFPRPATAIYTQALSRASMQTKKIIRLDLQLLAMAADARKLLSSKGIEVEDKILLSGFSASGMFVNRFTVLHPDKVKAAAIGSPGGWPIAPVAKYNGEDLRYPIGIFDLEKISLPPFNLQAFKAVPMYFYLGTNDVNDSVPYEDSYEEKDRELINKNFGCNLQERWHVSAEIYKSVESRAQFDLYPCAGHEITKEMKDKIFHFFYDVLNPTPPSHDGSGGKSQ
jgi:hypothetical protein